MGRNPANLYLFKANSRNAKKMYEIYSDITINIMESGSGLLLTVLVYCYC